MQNLPSRLHHSAVVSKDLGASREFYEGIMGLPLVATWCESNDALGEFCHAFFGLEDDSAVALFQFADDEKYQALRKPDTLSPFHHLALAGTTQVQDSVRFRADAAGIGHYTISHGYCVSLYLDDPDGHKVEITCDTQEATDNESLIRNRASEALNRWLSGDHTTNNTLRSATAE